MKKLFQDKKNWIFAAFAAVELVIFITFEALRFAAGNDAIDIKYPGILLCLAVAGLSCAFYGNDAKILLGGVFFTAISDLFILVLDHFSEQAMVDALIFDNEYIMGVCTFILAQLFYFARIYLTNGKKPYISIGVRVTLMVVALIVMGVTGKLTPLTGICCIYFPLLVCNCVESAFLIKISKRYILFFIGLLLFMCCDICVGLDNLGLNFPADVAEVINILIWTFYLPSQTLIVMSVRDAEYKPFFKKAKAGDEE